MARRKVIKNKIRSGVGSAVRQRLLQHHNRCIFTKALPDTSYILPSNGKNYFHRCENIFDMRTASAEGRSSWARVPQIRRSPSLKLRRPKAEREGFEPSVQLPVQRFSRPSHSTTLASFLFQIKNKYILLHLTEYPLF